MSCAMQAVEKANELCKPRKPRRRRKRKATAVSYHAVHFEDRSGELVADGRRKGLQSEVIRAIMIEEIPHLLHGLWRTLAEKA